MKIKYLFILLLIASLSACYEDKGNYDYREINELEILGISERYDLDLDDILTITPQLEGTLYNNPARFTFQWKIDGRVVSEEAGLDMVINLVPGLRKGRYMIKDKATGVVTYKDFSINVSSSTAGDLYMILSKSKGKAEMSYLRLDKENANFAVNYFENRFGRPLGTDPQKIEILYMQYGSASTALSPYIYPFGRNYGGVMVLADNRINILDKNSLEPDNVVEVLSGESYTGVVAYPKPNTEGYRSQFMTSHTEMWRTLANGATQTGFQFFEVSDGKIYSYACAGNMISSRRLYYTKTSPYPDGYLAPFCFFNQKTKNVSTYPVDYGYGLQDVLAYDMVNYRFTTFYYGSMYSIATTDLPAYTGFQLMYGSPTNEGPICYAILRNGSNSKIVILQRTSSSVYKQIGEANTSAVVNENSKFYTMTYSPYIFIATGDKVYVYNITDARTGVAPSATPVLKLSDCGYDATARITALCVSRSENRMLLGVSRYGSDTDAMGEENKGDLVQLTMNPSTFALTFDKTYKGVAGIPVDVKIKYQTHIRDGRDMNGVLVDKF